LSGEGATQREPQWTYCTPEALEHTVRGTTLELFLRYLASYSRTW
jgi:hypothetical protein